MCARHFHLKNPLVTVMNKEEQLMLEHTQNTEIYRALEMSSEWSGRKRSGNMEATMLKTSVQP